MNLRTRQVSPQEHLQRVPSNLPYIYIKTKSSVQKRRKHPAVVLAPINFPRPPPLPPPPMDVGGLDSEGRGFTSAREMWSEEIGLDEPDTGTSNSKRCQWYSKGISYWEVSNQSSPKSLNRFFFFFF